ncbi:AAA family ATPase [Bacillus velezensis]|uniref:AAA family ATPase n=1 Tax=Bacillus velezensis TaxID=492670 RepID=UPI002DBD253D|nr:AAA family ATPase [Bacillus velezensis]MEC1382458.1 AAA family ATPase [Bacillus velezensis]
MQFYNSYYIPDNPEYPCIHLKSDNWNDYGYQTSFYITYYDENGTELSLGIVKILEIDDSTTTKIPSNFTKLDDRYTSLGQTMEYYRKINALEKGEEILNALNDVIKKPHTLDQFRELEGFENSLLRNSEARLVLNKATSILTNEDIEYPEIGKVFFECQLPNAETSHKIVFDFEKHKFLPYRINALIGKNGTGKTEVLAHLANTISRNYNDREEEGVLNIINKDGSINYEVGPLFSRVITVSMSSFDHFNRVISSKYTSYKYCGIRDREGNINLDDMRKRLTRSYLDLKSLNREEIWKEILSETVDSQTIDIYKKFLSSTVDDENKLSSGQTMMLLVITNIVSFIQDNTLILFDEPELYLHPNAISGLIKMIYRILEEFNSYAVIATHSPKIIQEIPSRYVRVFRRIDNRTTIDQLQIESFGENLTVITNEVFSVEEDKFLYKDIMDKLSNELSFNQVNEMFDHKLSLNARFYLKSLYRRQQDK